MLNSRIDGDLSILQGTNNSNTVANNDADVLRMMAGLNAIDTLFRCFMTSLGSDPNGPPKSYRSIGDTVVLHNLIVAHVHECWNAIKASVGTWSPLLAHSAEPDLCDRLSAVKTRFENDDDIGGLINRVRNKVAYHVRQDTAKSLLSKRRDGTCGISVGARQTPLAVMPGPDSRSIEFRYPLADFLCMIEMLPKATSPSEALSDQLSESISKLREFLPIFRELCEAIIAVYLLSRGCVRVEDGVARA